MPGDIEPADDASENSDHLPSLPFPDPDTLEAYERVLPGFGHRWMTAWERALDRSYELRALEIEEEQKTSRRAWYTRELRLAIFGVLSMTYLFVGLVIGFDPRATAVMLVVVFSAALESLWTWIRRRRAKRGPSSDD